MSYTFAVLEISAAAFQEIRAKLEAAGYADQFGQHDGLPLIDMHGIALQPAVASRRSTDK